MKGPELLTGGSFGMEHSIVALVYCTTMGMILLMIAIRRGHLIKPAWKMQARLRRVALDLARCGQRPRMALPGIAPIAAHGCPRRIRRSRRAPRASRTTRAKRLLAVMD
jgi:hypothetical protein